MFITSPVLPQLLRYFQMALFEKRLLNIRIITENIVLSKETS